jgi:hypothetical protein
LLNNEKLATLMRVNGKTKRNRAGKAEREHTNYLLFNYLGTHLIEKEVSSIGYNYNTPIFSY